MYKNQGGAFKIVKISIQRLLKLNELFVGCTQSVSLDGIFIEVIFKPPITVSTQDPVTYAVKSLLADKSCKLSLGFFQYSVDSDL